MYKIENTVDLSSRFEEVLGLILTLGKLRSPFPPNLSRFILTLFEKKKKKTIYQVKLPLVIGIVSFNFDVGGSISTTSTLRIWIFLTLPYFQIV